ncbi:hypothetical protein ES703_29923 [subsurface metagenome]
MVLLVGEVRLQVLFELRGAIKEVIKLDRFCRLIPQVGTNLVYAVDGASDVSDIATISGRIISCMGKPFLCGDVVFGGSNFVASVILEAMKISPGLRSAINLRGDDVIAQALRDMGMDFVVLSSMDVQDVCPVTIEIKESGEVHRAYYHPGAFGVEASTTILGEIPMEIVAIVTELLEPV